ncbi:MAG TPA: hypothetical protein VLT62_19500 [Candidatus Methylomirabilis sp.]|nr:hypothetical protein [Candidatus Methylomirabilis sp.]
MNPNLVRGVPLPGGGQAKAPETAPAYPVKKFTGGEESPNSPALPCVRVPSIDARSIRSPRSTEAVSLRGSRLDSQRRSTDIFQPWVFFSIAAEIIATITSRADA